MEASTSKRPKNFSQLVRKTLKARHLIDFNAENSLPMLHRIKHYRAIFEPDDNAGRRSAINQLLDEAINRLRTLNEDAANIIEWRFVDGNSVEELTDRTTGYTKDVFMPKQRIAINQLANIIWDMELSYQKEAKQRLRQSLPQRMRTQIVGIHDMVLQVADQLLDTSDTAPILIYGIGGIGKTTLAETAVSRIIDQLAFTQIAWVTINNESLSNQKLDLSSLINPMVEKMGQDRWLTFDEKKQIQQLTFTFNNSPYLIIIDNNECPIDEALIAQLNEWSGRSRFLLTSRLKPPNETGLSAVAVDQLSLENTAKLIRAQALTESVEKLANLTNEAIEPIYAVVGGNPQAIKLVVGLTRNRPLTVILDDIPKATSKKIEALYTHIYWEAWKSMSENGRSLLQLMYSADEMGYDAEDLGDFSTLEGGPLWDAVDELMERSLMDKSLGIENPMYSIHRLTASFLQTEIINWPGLPEV